MPFKSEKQRRWMYANNPKMAKKWEKKEKYMKIRELIKKLVREELSETTKRDYKAEYKKFQSSDKSKKYRAELNKYNRQKGTYGNGDGKDASHKGGKIVGFEKESVNRGRAEKSRLKKEGKLTELNNFTPAQIKQLQKGFKNVKGILPDSNPVMIKLKKMLMQVDRKNLEMIANADIHILSQIAKKRLGLKEEKLLEAISGSDRKIMMMIVREILENLKKVSKSIKPSNQIGRGVLSILRAMTYTPDNANYKNYKKYFPKTFNSKLTQKRVKQFHSQTDKVQLTMVKQAMSKVLGERKLTEKKESAIDVVKRIVKNHQHEKGVDVQTANLILRIHNAYDKNPTLQKKFEKMPLKKMAQGVWRFVK